MRCPGTPRARARLPDPLAAASRVKDSPRARAGDSLKGKRDGTWNCVRFASSGEFGGVVGMGLMLRTRERAFADKHEHEFGGLYAFAAVVLPPGSVYGGDNADMGDVRVALASHGPGLDGVFGEFFRVHLPLSALPNKVWEELSASGVLHLRVPRGPRNSLVSTFRNVPFDRDATFAIAEKFFEAEHTDSLLAINGVEPPIDVVVARDSLGKCVGVGGDMICDIAPSYNLAAVEGLVDPEALADARAEARKFRPQYCRSCADAVKVVGEEVVRVNSPYCLGPRGGGDCRKMAAFRVVSPASEAPEVVAEACAEARALRPMRCKECCESVVASAADRVIDVVSKFCAGPGDGEYCPEHGGEGKQASFRVVSPASAAREHVAAACAPARALPPLYCVTCAEARATDTEVSVDVTNAVCAGPGVGYCLQNGGRGSQPQHGGRCSFCDHAARMRAAREARERAARALIPADQATYWRRQWRCICYFHDYPGHTYFCSQYCPYLPLPPT